MRSLEALISLIRTEANGLLYENKLIRGTVRKMRVYNVKYLIRGLMRHNETII